MRLTVFDLDKTLVTDYCGFTFCRYLVRKRVLSPLSLLGAMYYYVRHVCFGLSLFQLHQQVFSNLLKGVSLQSLEEHIPSFLDLYLPSHLRPCVMQVLQECQKRQERVLILSSSPSFLVGAIAQRLGIQEWFSTEYAVDNAGKLCHIAFMMQGEEKALITRRIAEENAISSDQITAYSDSIWDLPLLNTVGIPVAVCPDAALRRHAEQHHWKIL